MSGSGGGRERPRLHNVKPGIAPLKMSVATPAPRQVDGHYLTKEHVTWRFQVLARAGQQCQARDCKTPRRGFGRRLFADHIIELRDGGAPLDPANGQAL